MACGRRESGRRVDCGWRTDEGYVGERIHEKIPWFFPWIPNASGSGRILNMLLDQGLAGDSIPSQSASLR